MPAGLNCGGNVWSFWASLVGFLAMNGTPHAVTQLDIELGKHISVEDICFRYVPDSSSFYSVLNDKLLNGLILGHAPGIVHAANWVHVAAALFGTTIVSFFFFWSSWSKEKGLSD